MRVLGLFAGIGGFELGFRRAGFETAGLCEIDPNAREVLARRFPGVSLHDDVRTLDPPAADVVVAGFPCQDVSSSGRNAGMSGNRTSLVSEVFRVVDRIRPEWVVLENVTRALYLHRGAVIRYVVDELSRRGYMWAYRVVDTRSFGLPQRRRRLFVVASLSGDPRGVLLRDDAGKPEIVDPIVMVDGVASGFMHERDLNYVLDGIPTINTSNDVFFMDVDRRLMVPDIRDLERFQGFPVDWTLNDKEIAGPRYRGVGNAVSVPVAEWVARSIMRGRGCDSPPIPAGSKWSVAAWGDASGIYASPASQWIMQSTWTPLAEFVQFDGRPLSPARSETLLRRIRRGMSAVPPGFEDVVTTHLKSVS